MKLKYKALLIEIFLSISLMAFCVGCNAEFQERTSFPFEEVLIIKADLSDNWEWRSNEWIDENVYAATYTAGEGILLTHQVGVFQSREAAEIAYHEWEAEWFAGGWQPRSDATFMANDPLDQYRYECIDVTANGRPKSPCRYLQQHGRFVSLIRIGIDGEAITFGEFNELLQIVDHKLNTVE